MNCPNCGTELANFVTVPEEYKPIRGIGYCGYMFLLSIPVIGFIIAIVFACGGCNNINLRNFARGYLWTFLIGVIISTIITVCAVALGASVLSTIY